MRSDMPLNSLPQVLALGLAFLAAVSTARADTLKLDDGTVLRGRYAGGTPGLIRFETRDGMENILRARARMLTFTEDEDRLPEADTPRDGPREAARRGGPRGAEGPGPLGGARGGRFSLRPGVEGSPARETGGAREAPAAERDPAVTVPAGSVLTVKLGEAVTAKTGVGRKIPGQLAGNLLVGGQLAAASGTRVLAEVRDAARAGPLAGKSKLAVVVTHLDFSGTLVPVVTEAHVEEATGSLRKTARNAALGALIGEAVDDDAAPGAAIGAGSALAKDGESLELPSGTILDFELIQPFTTP